MSIQRESGSLLPALGVITNVSDYMRNTSALKVGNNLNIIKQGVITNRYVGWVRATDDPALNAIDEMAIYTGSDGIEILLIKAGATLYYLDGTTLVEIDCAGGGA